MGTITINGKKYEFTNEKNILTIIRNAGIEVPTLCYQPELSVFGACRLCTVEDDRGRCFASCSVNCKCVFHISFKVSGLYSGVSLAQSAVMASPF